MRTNLLLFILSFCSILAFGQTGFVQEGKASFYADKFEGRTTASGERYSHSRSTCAHLSLPFGTLVRVTNLSNNKSVVVRVNDRGPFVPDRIIDLSRSAAEKLDFISEGIANVKIEAIDEEGKVAAKPAAKPKPAVTSQPPQQPVSKQLEPTRPEVAEPSQAAKSKPAAKSEAVTQSDYELYDIKVTRQEPGGFAVQIGSYKELSNLLRNADEIKSSLGKDVRVQVTSLNGERLYRLLIGNFKTRDDAESLRRRAAADYPDCLVVELK